MNNHDALPIDAGVVDGWQGIDIDESGEPLVPIGRGTEFDDIVTSAVYAGEHLHSPYRGDNVIDVADPVIYVRKSVAERLRNAQAALPEGMRLIVFDGYRSAAVQSALFDQFIEELRLLKPDWNEDRLTEETEHYVALPSEDITRPSPHSTGGAVDVAIIKDGKMIEFGTPFDHGSERSALRYFEDDTHVATEADIRARDNRRLLYRAMHDAGFEAYEHEWWHYNARETQMGSSAAKLGDAHYGKVSSDMLDQARVTIRIDTRDANEPSAPIDRIAPTN